MAEPTLAVGVDIGGTKTAAVVVNDEGRILDRARRPSASTDADQLVEEVAALVLGLRERHEVGSVGIGVAGLVDPEGDVVMTATHLALDGHPLRAKLEAAVGLPVRVDNDGTVAAWAEYRFGAGVGADPLLVVTVGTGLGGGLVVGGRLVRGAFGTAGEVGHVVLERDGRPCSCGDRGCVEQYASGRALLREARALVRDFPGASPGLVQRCGGDPARLDGPAVTAAAVDGDVGALRAFALVGAALGRGIASIANVLDPSRVVIGGGVAEAGELLMAPTREAFAAHVVGHGHREAAELVLATLGNEAGAVGAADLGRRAALVAGRPVTTGTIGRGATDRSAEA